MAVASQWLGKLGLGKCVDNSSWPCRCVGFPKMLRYVKCVFYMLWRYSFGKATVRICAKMGMPCHIKPCRTLMLLLIAITSAFCLILLIHLRTSRNNHQEFDPITCKKYNAHAFSFPINDSTEPENEKNFLRGVIENTPRINNYNFLYPINVEGACIKFKVDVLLPIHSAVSNFKRRKMMRKSCQGLYASNPQNRAVLLFFVGLPNKLQAPLELQQELVKESKRHGDIVQIDIEDVYHNISLKALGVLNWISEYCKSSEFVLKTDDDIAVDAPKSVTALHWTRRKHPHFVMGFVRRVGRPRFVLGKYAVDKEAYPHSTYPPYVAGGAMGYPSSTAILLYQQALRLKRLWLDDVFISGLCTHELGIPVIGASEFAYNHIYTE